MAALSLSSICTEIALNEKGARIKASEPVRKLNRRAQEKWLLSLDRREIQ
jgi:hypothetical protein